MKTVSDKQSSFSDPVECEFLSPNVFPHSCQLFEYSSSIFRRLVSSDDVKRKDLSLDGQGHGGDKGYLDFPVETVYNFRYICTHIDL